MPDQIFRDRSRVQLHVSRFHQPDEDERRDAAQPTPRGGDGVSCSAGSHQTVSSPLPPPPLLPGERIHARAPRYQERLAILPFLLRGLVALLDVKQHVRQQQKRAQSSLHPHLHTASKLTDKKEKWVCLQHAICRNRPTPPC